MIRFHPASSAAFRQIAVVTAILATIPAMTWANVSMPHIFGDHMVLQQGIKIPVWGWADPGERIAVTFGDKTARTKADASGCWRVDLDRSEVDATPRKLTVAGRNTIEFDDVLVGDVWLCSGQSNMEFQLMEGSGGAGHGGVHNAEDAVLNASDPQLRLFRVTRKTSFEPMKDVEGKWEVCDPESVKPFSAVGYFFGRELRTKLNRPIGLIGSYWGGTSVTYWTSWSGLEKRVDTVPEIIQWGKERQKLLEEYPAQAAAYPTLKEKYEQDLKRWVAEVDQAPDFMQKKAAWEVDAHKARGQNLALPPRPQPSRPRPIEPPDPGKRIVVSSLYNGMIAPLVPYGIKGVIWYQGEAHAGNKHWYQYRPWFSALIEDWRDKWSQGDFPFLFVQLAAFGADAPANELIQTADGWPGVREAQMQTLSLPNTGMATAIDLGDLYDVHPKDKVDVGMRLALAARHVAYGENLVVSGPVYYSMKVERDKIRVTFKGVGGGLEIGVPPWVSKGEVPLPAGELQGFAIAGADRKFVWAKARIEGNDVVVWSDAVPDPAAVRYGWANYPYLNLYNKERLPALPFRTDDWKP